MALLGHSQPHRAARSETSDGQETDQVAYEMAENHSTAGGGSWLDGVIGSLGRVERLILALAGVITAVGTLYALFGDGDTSSSAGPTFVPGVGGLRIEAWADLADAECEEAGPEFSAANQRTGPGPNQAELVRMTDATARVAFGLATELRGIGTPSTDQADVERFISRWEQAAAAMQDLSRAAELGDQQAIDTAAARYAEEVDRSAELARGLGADQCAALAG